MKLFKNLKELKLRLGFFLFYCQYIKEFSSIIKLMYKLMQMKKGKHISFIWNKKKQKVFNEIKKKIIIALIITYLDFEKPFILYMNASEKGIRTILYQKNN